VRLVTANRYRVAGHPHYRITVDYGGASLEMLGANGWRLEAAGRTLDDLLHAPQLTGVTRLHLIAEAE
jgi:hypothetical protein